MGCAAADGSASWLIVRLESSTPLPSWARFAAVAFALLFGVLTWWVAGLVASAGTEAVLVAIGTGLIALRLLIAAIQGEWTFRTTVFPGFRDDEAEDDLMGRDHFDGP